MRSRHRRFIGSIALAIVAMALALVLWPVARASAAEFEIYVSDKGNDATGDGSEELPYASIAKAFEYIDSHYGLNDHVTVYVLSNLTATSSARYWDANVTVIGKDGQWTITRSRDFEQSQDDARLRYNGALIEVNGSLTIGNLILDDGGIHASSDPYYTQTSTDMTGSTSITWTDKNGRNYSGADLPSKISNNEIVQDAIISAYDGKGSIILDEGAVLKNYGGMSAVRVTGTGGKLVMKSGSQILDTLDATINRTSTSRTADKTTYYAGTGPAGAVWIQGGAELIMEGGTESSNSSCIKDLIDSRAIYLDGGSATLNGYIGNIRLSSRSWNGTSGAVHVRGGGNAILTSTIENISGGGSAVYVVGGTSFDSSGQTIDLESTFEMTPSSRIMNCTNVSAVQISGVNKATATINGTISGVKNANVININSNGLFRDDETHGVLHCTIGENGKIIDNTPSAGAIYIQTNDGHLDIFGTISNNRATSGPGAIWMAHNFAKSTVVLHPGARIENNSGPIAGGVNVSNGTFIMKPDSTVSNNRGTGNGSGENVGVGGIWVRNGGTFKMEGGIVFGNTSESTNYNGVAIDLIDYTSQAMSTASMPASISTVQLEGGDIKDEVVLRRRPSSGDTDGFGRSDRYISVSDAVNISSDKVRFEEGKFYLENLGDDVKLGNASKAAEDAATRAYTAEGLTEVVGSFWYATDGAAREFSISGLKYNENKPLYAAVMKTDANGQADGDSVTLRSVKVNDDGTLSLSLPGQYENGYAVVFLQQAPEAKTVSIIPADVTVYEGGEGYGAVIGKGDGEAKDDSTMPRPLFIIEGIPTNNENLVFVNRTNNKTWTAVSDENGYYHFKSGSDQDDVRVTYTDAAGNKVISDKFEVSNVKDTFKQFSIDLFLGENDLGSIEIDGHTDYQIVLGTGILTVRAVETDPTDAVSRIINAEPSMRLESGKAIAVAPIGTTYTLNNTDVKLPPNDSRPSLLFDDIITSDNAEREAALKSAVDAKLDGDDSVRQYEMKYLDLVDANNSNAWIKASGDVTVYWGYPEGTDKSTDFKLYHFEGLHRDGANSGYDVEDISSATIETVDVTNTDKGIAFTVERGGFSPFVLVWDRPSGGSVTPPATTYTITASAGSGGSISPSGEVTVRAGASQSFTVTPDEGNKVRDVVIDGTSVGSLASYTFENVRGDHTISVTFNRGNAPADPDDTGISDWFETVDHNAFLYGYDDGTGRFGPENNMTRAEAAAMFYNMLRDKSRGDVEFGFEDLPEDAWYYEAVATMASHGILLGTSPTTVEPERPITRAEFTAMAMRFTNGDVSGENIFTDVHEGDWYYGVIVGSIKYGWISGYDDGTGRFGPNDNITRAQATIIANRMLGRVPDGVYVKAHLDDIKRFPDVDDGYYAFLDIVEATNSHDYAKDGGFEHWSGLR